MELALRAQIRDALLRTTLPALRVFADALFAREGDRMACWGNLADLVLDCMEHDADRIAFWRALVDVGDRRALLLFLDLNRDRPAALAAILDDADRLSPALQRALVSMPEAAALLERALPKLGPSALELLGGGEDALARERALYEAHMASLRAQRAAAPCPLSLIAAHDQVPEAVDPGDLA
jgi:hypothetical protein